jgi:hypothetical protein
VLARAGFVQVGSETAHADGVGRTWSSTSTVSTSNPVAPRSTNPLRDSRRPTGTRPPARP